MDTCHSGEVDKTEAGAAPIVGQAANPYSIEVRGKEPTEDVHVQAVPRAVSANSRKPLGYQGALALMQEQFVDLRRGSGAVVISAASGEGYSLESAAWKNGVFTASVLEALQTGPIRVSKLRESVFDQVQKRTAGRQTPTSRQENITFDFIVN
jgi:hypothetical protein